MNEACNFSRPWEAERLHRHGTEQYRKTMLCNVRLLGHRLGHR